MCVSDQEALCQIHPDGMREVHQKSTSRIMQPAAPTPPMIFPTCVLLIFLCGVLLFDSYHTSTTPAPDHQQTGNRPAPDTRTRPPYQHQPTKPGHQEDTRTPGGHQDTRTPGHQDTRTPTTESDWHQNTRTSTSTRPQADHNQTTTRPYYLHTLLTLPVELPLALSSSLPFASPSALSSALPFASPSTLPLALCLGFSWKYSCPKQRVMISIML